MAYDFVVIGATGLQGRIVSRDLLEKGYRVLLCGRKQHKLEPLLRRKQAVFNYLELKDNAHTAQTLRNADAQVVVNCAEGDYNLDVQRISLKTGSHYVDLGSDVGMTRKQFAMHKAFQRKKLTAMTGCGSVPGIGNVMLRYANEKLDTVTNAEAGFAWTANMPAFVVPFSITSIIEEFTDKPTIVEKEHFKKVEPLGNDHVMRFMEIGNQREFLVRHPETYTFYEYLKPKGVKNVQFYAGFPDFSYEIIMAFIKSGLGSRETMPDGMRPIDHLAEALKANKAPEGYREKENLWVTVTGTKDGKPKTIKMNCIVPTLRGWEEHGCNIDTGLPCSIMAQMIKEGVITETGSRSPEFFVPVQPFFETINKRKMHVYENGKKVS